MAYMTEHDVCEILKIAMPNTDYLNKLLTIASAFYRSYDNDMEHNRPATAAFSRKIAESICNQLMERGVIHRD